MGPSSSSGSRTTRSSATSRTRRENPYLDFYERVVDAQASLVAQWMLVGFIHGVMNTDNMSISGETIDYGPCAFMDAFDPDTVFSSIDYGGRYAYGNQPAIGAWNLARLAETLLPLLDDDTDAAVAAATTTLERFPERLNQHWRAGMRDQARAWLRRRADRRVPHAAARAQARLHLDVPHPVGVAARGGARCTPASRPGRERWREQSPDPDAMDRVNPVYIPRNHLVEEALAARGDLEPFHRLVEAVSRPFDERPGLERYASPAPESFGPYQTFCGT